MVTTAFQVYCAEYHVDIWKIFTSARPTFHLCAKGQSFIFRQHFNATDPIFTTFFKSL